MVVTDMSATLAALPKRQGAKTLVSRGREKYITVHYSGVVYGDNTRAAEIERIKSETIFHLQKNWGTKTEPIYGDGLMYDYVVLKSGEVVQTRNQKKQLWHCRNKIGNEQSWSVHVMLGRNEALTATQRAGLFNLLDMIRAECNIPRSNVVGHCEWPASNGKPVIGSSYRVLTGQSECPGPIIMRDVYAYRAITDEMIWRTGGDYEVVGNVPFTFVRTARSFDSAVATLDGKPAMLWPGTVFSADDVTDGWAHMVGGLGFVHTSDLKAVGAPDPELTAQTVGRIYSGDTWLVTDTQASVDPEKIITHLTGLPNQPYSAEEIRHIVYTYKHVGEEVSIDWVFALSQNLLETNRLRSWWAAPPRRNPAGLFVTGKAAPSPSGQHWAFDETSGLWKRGMTFEDWDQAIRTHYAYLVHYATTERTMTEAQRAVAEYAPNRVDLQNSSLRASAQQIKGFLKRWATDPNYVLKLTAAANSLSKLK
jgi:N-acetylmuramoyl-L-alanine amidase/Mannosyl-glycoprotein endo-beta-N-acetylglucosaminidase